MSNKTVNSHISHESYYTRIFNFGKALKSKQLILSDIYNKILFQPEGVCKQNILIGVESEDTFKILLWNLAKQEQDMERWQEHTFVTKYGLGDYSTFMGKRYAEIENCFEQVLKDQDVTISQFDGKVMKHCQCIGGWEQMSANGEKTLCILLFLYIPL